MKKILILIMITIMFIGCNKKDPIVEDFKDHSENYTQAEAEAEAEMDIVNKLDELEIDDPMDSEIYKIRSEFTNSYKIPNGLVYTAIEYIKGSTTISTAFYIFTNQNHPNGYVIIYRFQIQSPEKNVLFTLPDSDYPERYIKLINIKGLELERRPANVFSENKLS